ncbi:PHD finger protein 12 [Caerostris extrusa]|uniref:PHD finger protein 12 n=1 Tax=Caerostris extrusa TaxID=172846 RepID=A0AAV4PB09_CAEEX|nr:PHD finger protein 12 [Caerostris extrusa]
MHRRLGRSVNHDSCDGCKEGGDLICCDLIRLCQKRDLPSGDWLCHRCITTSEVEECVPSSDPVVCAMEEDPVNESEPLLWHPTIISEVDESLSVHFFKSLMGQQTVKNPAQYQVPDELAFATQFPGSSKKAGQGIISTSDDMVRNQIQELCIYLPSFVINVKRVATKLLLFNVITVPCCFMQTA